MTPEEQDNLARILASPSYVLAERDLEFMSLPETRPVRLQLELMKPEYAMQKEGIHSTIVVFGSTRVLDLPEAEARLAAAEHAVAESVDVEAARKNVEIARRVLKKSWYYDEARKLARIVSEQGQKGGWADFVVVTGGGPGIMEAANRGAHDIGAKSIGFNITLPHEQAPNAFITPELCFQFHYFAIRKMHFLMRAKALVAFPGGYGTLDELFETLTLIQTGKMPRVPVILVGREYWSKLIDWQFLVDEGTIAPDDIDLLQYAESAEEVWKLIAEFHADAVQRWEKAERKKKEAAAIENARVRRKGRKGTTRSR
jgi:hypothetical protein